MSDSVSAQPSSPGLPKGAFQVLKVALPSPLRRLFDYLPAPRAPACGWQPGLRVRVPFGRRDVVGVVVSLASLPSLPLLSGMPAMVMVVI